MNDNIVKKVCKELGITYKELGERIGYSESNINKIASTGKISNQVKKAIELYLENLELKKEVKQLHNLKTILKDLLS
jgi:predicted transcriptional regulator